MARHYIQALDADGAYILGNLDGQASIEGVAPLRSRAWKRLPYIKCSKRVARWRLVDHKDRVIAEKVRPLPEETK